MDQKYLIINLGSQSKKYALATGGKVVARAHLEPGIDLSPEQFAKGLDLTLERWQKDGLLGERQEIAAIGIRIVAPGTFFAAHRLFDDEYRKRLASVAADWPLHLAPVIAELAFIDQLLPGVPLWGLSDSAFHVTLSERAHRLPLQRELSERLDLYHFGYHGLSLGSIVHQLKASAGGVPERLIVAHLGGGESITALKHGASIDTSMSFSPLGGVPMSTRTGDLDPGALIHLFRHSNLSGADLLRELETNSGLFALSNNQSGEVRELLKEEAAGSPTAQLAIETMLASIIKWIGAYWALLGGADLIVLTGTIAERSTTVVDRLRAMLQSLALPEKIVVLPTDETAEMLAIVKSCESR